jgi:hypothetical protein
MTSNGRRPLMEDDLQWRENLEEISSVALLSPACFQIFSTECQDQYFATRPRMRLLLQLTNGRIRDRDFLITKSGTRPGRDRDLSIIKI